MSPRNVKAKELRYAIEEKCRHCYKVQCKRKKIYPSHFWRVEVEKCEHVTCPLYSYRPVPYGFPTLQNYDHPNNYREK